MIDTSRLVYFALRRSAVNPNITYLVITDEDGIDSAAYALTPADLIDLRSELSQLEESPHV